MPEQETLTKFNWIDLLALLLFLRTCATGSKSGLIAGLFKIAGLVASLYVSLHYFSQVGNYLAGLIPPLGVPFSNFICFIILAILPYLSVAIVRQTVMRLVKVEATSAIDRWGGLLFGFFIGVMMLSTLFIGFYASNIIYLKESVRKSYMGNRIAYANVKVYEFIFNGIVSKFTPHTELNKGIYEVFEGRASGEAL